MQGLIANLLLREFECVVAFYQYPISLSSFITNKLQTGEKMSLCCVIIKHSRGGGPEGQEMLFFAIGIAMQQHSVGSVLQSKCGAHCPARHQGDLQEVACPQELGNPMASVSQNPWAPRP